MQQHVERIYDLVFISLFNTILVALRAREWVEKERKQGEKMKGELDSFTVSKRPDLLVEVELCG